MMAHKRSSQLFLKLTVNDINEKVITRSRTDHFINIFPVAMIF